MTTAEPRREATVTVMINGKPVGAPPGELLIKVAQDHGVYIPRFCWHERMKPVGMCRMCLVEVDGVRGYPAACTTPVTDGMVCHTESATVRKLQDGILEFLLINHPLDCPVCDRGGECPLQDQTLAFGPGESRFVEEKRHWEKPIRLSNLVLLDRERCIQCARCTRFADEIAGDPLIDFVDRSDQTQVLNFAAQPFDSYFSGNTVQICPVGALLSRQYRFKARPWDLTTAETSCTTCAVQCRGAVQSASNRVIRLLGVDSEPVNHGWLCDKGRYGIEWINSDDRLLHPQMRVANELSEVSWPEALDAAVDEIKRARELHGAGSIAVLGGARGTNEDAYAWARLAKGVIGTDNVDCQLGDGLPAEFVLGVPRAELADLDRAATIVVLAPDLKEELPVCYLRVRRAAVELDVPLVDLSPMRNGLTPYVTASYPAHPGEAIGPDAVARIAELATARDGPVVVIVGRPSLAEWPDATLRSAAALMRLPNVSFLSALARSNVHGALDAGLAPGYLPGRVALDAARDWYTERWGAVPESRGLDAADILRAAADGRIHVLILVGADPLSSFPDAQLARRALDGAAYTIVVDAFLPESMRRADIFLPVALWAEKSGSVTNIEGRMQRVSRKVAPEGTAMDDWRIATELAFRLGSDFDFATVDEVADEVAAVAPAMLGAAPQLLRRARDGVVLPLREHFDEIVVRTGELSIMAEDGHGVSWDPIKVDGEAAADAPDVDTHEVDDARAAARVAAPMLHAWTPADTGVAPGRDGYALRLVASRPCYDGSRVVVQTPILATLTPAPVLHVNPQDLARLGVADGTDVKLTSSLGSLTRPVVANPGVPVGVCVMPFSGDGAGPALLINANARVTDLRVETL
ncbi:MAG: NADH-quinone oxidoreductase subunit NuoG [Actinomycetota bacterium]